MTRQYPSVPRVGLGVALFRPGAVLLVRRANPPAQGEWSLPGGAQLLGETAEQGARRELAEETSLEAGTLHLAGHVDSIHHDADGQIIFHYTILDFCGLWQGGQARAGTDAADAQWADLDRLDDYNLWSEARRIIQASRLILGC